MKAWAPPERLVIAADFGPGSDGVREAMKKVYRLVDYFKNTGIYLKLGSVLRAVGYGLIDDLHRRGIKVFADLKLFDIEHTLTIDGALLSKMAPEIVTVSASSSLRAMRSLKATLPDAEVLGVAVLTDCGDDHCQTLYGVDLQTAFYRLATKVHCAGLDGMIASVRETHELRACFPEMSIHAVAIRPRGYIAEQKDDQQPGRMATPTQAIHAGARRIIVGRPITESKNPYDAAMKIIEEIRAAADNPL